MDVYGFPPYQYAQTDELAKQTFAQQQQALASSMPYPNRGMPEGHVMPAPTGAPWNVQGLPWGLTSPPELVQFTAASREVIEQDDRLIPAIQCKRKSLEVEPLIPSKQRITEEKMAAHLNGLHISSEYTPHYLAGSDVMDIEPSTSGAIEPSTSKLKGHTIVLSEEIKKMQDQPLLPAALIERLENPRMSLVVWKPREKIILPTLNEDDKSSKDKEQSPRRNGVLVTGQPVNEDVEM